MLRFDSAPISGTLRTDGGLLRVPARVTRTGVFTYYTADGKPWRELRHPDDVFSPESLATMRGVPVVIGHPDRVTADNWGTYAKGDVRDDVARDGDYVLATLAVNDAPTIGQVEAKALTEVSMAYTADIVNEPGEYNGEKYDARQTNIRYNHAGLGPKDWGRAGNSVRVIMDGKEAELYTDPMDLKEALEKLAAATVRADGYAGQVEALAKQVKELTEAKEQAEAKARKDAQDAADKARADAEKAVQDRIAKLEEAVAKRDGSHVADEAANAAEAARQDAEDPVEAAHKRMVANYGKVGK